MQDFEGLDSIFDSEFEEPEWMQLNRQWVQANPSVLEEKRPFAVYDAWFSLESPCSQRAPPSFIDDMEVEELVDEQLDNYNIARLFAEAEDHPPDHARRPWTAEEEETLLHFISATGDRKISGKDWHDLSQAMSRNVSSLKNKASKLKKFGLSQKEEVKRVPRKLRTSLADSIKQCLESLPDRCGSAEAVISKMKEGRVDSDLKWEKSVRQKLCSSFSKIPGVYSLQSEAPSLEKDQCQSMTDYIRWALQSYGPSTKKQLKEIIYRNFQHYLNEAASNSARLKLWEVTFLKKLKTCPYINSTLARTLYTIDS